MSRKSRKHAAHPKAVTRAPAPSGRNPRTAPARPTVVTVCACLIIAVFLVFGRTAAFDFLDYDDIGYVSQNPMVAQGLTFRGVLWAFTHSEIGSWVPLTTLSHMLDCQVFGQWAGGHHLVNVLLHAVTAVLLFLVLRDMTGALWRPALVAAVFALHPLRVESVAWISERKDTLAGLFFVLTLGAYVRWTRRSSGSRLWVTLSFAFGLLSKSMLVTTPVILLLLDWWPLHRTTGVRFWRLLTEKAPLIILAIMGAVAQLVAARETMDNLMPSPLGTRVANAVVSSATYIGQMFWPANLAGFYPFPRHGTDPFSLLLSAVLLIAISAAAYRWRRAAPWLVVGWLWYLIMLLPVLGLVQAGEVSRADRYTYLPQIGLYLILAWAAGTWCEASQNRRVAIASLAIVALVASSAMAHRQTGFWKDSETMWHRALACTTHNDTAHYNLGTAALQKGNVDDAIAHYQKTIDANPAFADAHMNLGRALLQKGMPDQALAHYRNAIDLKPHYAEAHYNLGMVLTQSGELDKAIACYRRAIEINPAYFDARNNLGSALLQAGQLADAITEYEIALRIDPGSARAHNNLAAALVQKGRIVAAIRHYEKVLEIDPDHVKAHNSLAWLLATSADPANRQGTRAVQLAQRAIQLSDGETPIILRTLAAAHAEAGDFANAFHTAQRALDLALTQRNDPLSAALRSDLELYKENKPVR